MRTEKQLAENVAEVVASLRAMSSEAVRDGLARYGIPADHALGIPMARIQGLAKRIGPDQALAEELWKTEIYEARLLVAYIGEPEKLTRAQMDAWCVEFDSWAVVDTLCFVLFNETPHAWGRAEAWTKRKPEFEKRAGFALLACLSHPKRPGADADFEAMLPVIARGAADDRNFVKKGVSWALRMVGRRNLRLHKASVALARELAESASVSTRWVGRDALRDLTRPMVAKRVEALERKALAKAAKKRR